MKNTNFWNQHWYTIALLPKELRNMTSCGKEAFKKSLDQFLKTVRDEPQICGYTSFRSGASNSLLDMV